MNETYDVVVVAVINGDLAAADAERAVTLSNMRKCA
jgi:hypothetical protein